MAYAYDPVGNRTNQFSNISGVPTDAYAYDSFDQLESDTNNTGYGNDSDYNMTQLGSNTYVYDPLNQLRQGPSGYYNYDGDGNRVLENGLRYYVVDDRNPSGYPQVLEEFSQVGANFALTRTYNYGLALISQQQFDTNTLLPSVLSYYGYDGHGSVRFLMGTNGTVTDTYTYDAFGTLLTPVGTTPNNYLYCCQYWDSDLQLYYNRARYMAPGVGRFMSMDGDYGNNQEPLSLHKYLYAEDDPVDNMDPLGSHIISPTDPVNKPLYDEAINYLKGSNVPIVDEILDRLESSKFDYKINIYDFQARDNETYNEFDSSSRTVHWDPHMSSTWFVPDDPNKPDGPGVILSHSPAIALIHELGHAYHLDTLGLKMYKDNGATDTGDDFDNLEERNTILKIEDPVAKALGEPERFTHHGIDAVEVKGPTSRATDHRLGPLPMQGGGYDLDGSELFE